MIDLAKMKADAQAAFEWPGLSQNEHIAHCSPQTILKLLAVVDAADLYYRRYCQDEAAEDGPFDTGCTLSQHEDALELRKALAALESKPATHKGAA